MPLPVAVSRDPRRTVSVIIAIDAAAFVAMKPRPVTAERKENRQRDVVSFHIARSSRHKKPSRYRSRF